MKKENMMDTDSNMEICESADICEYEDMDICEKGPEDICEHEDQQVFQVQTEDGVVHDATLLSVVEIDGKEYAVYAIPNGLKNVDILASYVEKDEDGYDVLRDITDPVDKAKISEFVKSLTL